MIINFNEGIFLQIHEAKGKVILLEDGAPKEQIGMIQQNEIQIEAKVGLQLCGK